MEWVIPGIAPPSRTRQVLNTWPFYIVVVGAMPATLWLVSFFTGWHVGAVIPALVLTVMAGLLCWLRYLRGSRIESEKERFYERQEYFRREEEDPLSVAVKPSNRVGQRLEKNEYVVWEFRVHPIMLVKNWFHHIFQTKIGLVLTGSYVLACSLIIDGNFPEKLGVPWWASACLILSPGLYFWFTTAQWNSDRYALTNKRFIAVLGLFKKQFGAIPRPSMVDQNDNTTNFGELLADARLIDSPYGWLRLESLGAKAGNIPEVVEGVPHIAHNLTMFRPRPS